MVLFAFTGDGKVCMEAVEPGTAVTSEIYIEFLRKVGDKWRTLRSSPTRLNQLIWMHDNARPHTAASTMEFLEKRNVTCIKQAPYSPDLNMCDRWIFKELKKHLRNCSIQSKDDVVSEALQWF